MTRDVPFDEEVAERSGSWREQVGDDISEAEREAGRLRIRAMFERRIDDAMTDRCIRELRLR